jgi:hypothetical protein
MFRLIIASASDATSIAEVGTHVMTYMFNTATDAFAETLGNFQHNTQLSPEN